MDYKIGQEVWVFLNAPGCNGIGATGYVVGFTAKRMGQGFIDNIDNLLTEWKPQPRFSVVKVDDSTKLDNYNPTPISLTPEFLKEIQSI